MSLSTSQNVNPSMRSSCAMMDASKVTTNACVGVMSTSTNLRAHESIDEVLYKVPLGRQSPQPISILPSPLLCRYLDFFFAPPRPRNTHTTTSYSSLLPSSLCIGPQYPS